MSFGGVPTDTGTETRQRDLGPPIPTEPKGTES